MGDNPLLAAWKLGSCAAHCTRGGFGSGAQARLRERKLRLTQQK